MSGMERKAMHLTICGGGSLGHICLAVLSAQSDLRVNLYTQHPSRWQPNICVTDLNGKQYVADIACISDRPEEVITGADIVLFCLPGFAIEPTLQQIAPHLSPTAVVGTIVSSTGFFFAAHRVLGEERGLFGFQRVPFIARVVDYGQRANLLGYKSSLAVAIEHHPDAESLRTLIERWFQTPTRLLGSYYEAALTNSNPILHTGRLFSMWRDWNGEPYDRCLLFYKEWTVEAAQILIEMDAEFMSLLEVLPMDKGAIPPLLDYYESDDATSLAAKLQSIAAFQSIQAPMRQVADNQWIPDFTSRYFTEDFPYGLRFIVELARQYGVATPRIDEVFAWGMSKLQTNN